MNPNPETGIQELQAILHQKQVELEAAAAKNAPKEQVSKLYKDIKEAQYQLVLLRNNILDPSQSSTHSAVL